MGINVVIHAGRGQKNETSMRDEEIDVGVFQYSEHRVMNGAERARMQAPRADCRECNAEGITEKVNSLND